MPIAWLFTVACKQCTETIQSGPAPSPAEMHAPVSEPAGANCPHCAAVHSSLLRRCSARLSICRLLKVAKTSTGRELGQQDDLAEFYQWQLQHGTTVFDAQDPTPNWKDSS